MSLRTAARRLAASSNRLASSGKRTFATKYEVAQLKEEEENNKAREALEAEKSSVQKYVEITREMDPTMAWGTMIAPEDPDLPEDPSEIAATDPTHLEQDPASLATGEPRIVHIKQQQARVSQAPTNLEKQWVISFQDEGELSQCWDNPLMGWVSSSDPMANNMRLQMAFRNASDAVYFAKKRGWNYVVEKPIMRQGRSDDAQYQDNFLPQAIASKVRREKKKCDHWHRDEASTSHYFRPLKYHGNGTVVQHGPNGEDDIAPHVEGIYKMR